LSDLPSSLKRAVVTGSSSGIGRAIAQALLDAGWRVTGFDLAPPTLAHAVFDSVSVDLTDGDAITGAASTVTGIDAFVHAAGVLRVGNVGALDHAGGALMWKLHVDAATRLADALIPKMAERGNGRVVLIGSRVASGMAGRSQYAATKAALIALARSWAAEVAPRGVTVNVVSPAATATAMLEDPSRASAAPKLPPIGRMIQPEEVAALVTFLLSQQAAAITGQDIQICGGSSLAR
jgi:NAD(P)-dependent dehydrogenase (short-subunit alcohol dehydrogenase family)